MSAGYGFVSVGRSRLCWLAGPALWLAWCAAAAVPTVAAEIERASAFCYFTTNAASYHDAVAAHKLAELVQAELLGETDLDWLDRGRIDEALGEMELSAFGQVDAASAVRLGHWIKSDLLVKGTVIQGRKQWRLQLEVIDLNRADVLSVASMALAGDEAGGLAVRPADVQRAAAAARQAIEQGLATRATLRRRIRVARLYFRNAESTSRLDFLEADLRRRFRQRNAQQQRVRYLQFPRAGDAIEEANLVASGIAAANQEAWQHVADYYVWGSFREVNSAGVAFDDVQVEVTLEVWDGRGQVQRLTRRGKVKQLPRLIESVVHSVERLAARRNPDPPPTDVRRRIAEDLRVRAAELQEWVVQTDDGDLGRPTDDWMRLWRQCIRMLAAAAFFDPTNEAARRELLIETTRSDNYHLYGLTGMRDFWRKWRRSDAWKSHCRQFGYDYKHAHQPKLKHRFGTADNRIQHGAQWIYLVSAEDALKAAPRSTAKNRRRRRGSDPHWPGDVPPEVRLGWQRVLGQEYVDRLKFIVDKDAEFSQRFVSRFYWQSLKLPEIDEIRAQAIQLLWPLVIKDESFRLSYDEKIIVRTFTNIGQPEVAERLLAMVTPERRARGKARVVPPRPLEPVATLDSVPENLRIAPVAKAPLRRISLGRRIYLQRVKALCFAGNRLWIGAGGQNASTLRQEFALFSCRADGTDIRRFANIGGANSQVTQMIADGEQMWLALDGDGVCRVDLKTNRVRQFTPRDGLPSPKILSLAHYRRTWYAGGGQEQRGVLGALVQDDEGWAQLPLMPPTGRNVHGKTTRTAQVTQLACNQNWLGVYAHHGHTQTQILCRPRSGGRWLRVGEMLQKLHPEFSHFTRDWRVAVVKLMFIDDWLWIVTTRGIAAYDPATGKFPFVQAIPWQAADAVVVGGKIWMPTAPFTGRWGQDANAARCLLAFDPHTRKWTSQIDVPVRGYLSRCTHHADTIWMSVADGQRNAVVAVDISSVAD